MKRKLLFLFFLLSFFTSQIHAQAKKGTHNDKDTVLVYFTLHIPITQINPKGTSIMTFDLDGLKVKSTVAMVRKVNEGNDAEGTFKIVLYCHFDGKSWYLTDYRIVGSKS